MKERGEVRTSFKFSFILLNFILLLKVSNLLVVADLFHEVIRVEKNIHLILLSIFLDNLVFLQLKFIDRRFGIKASANRL